MNVEWGGNYTLVAILGTRKTETEVSLLSHPNTILVLQLEVLLLR